MSESPEVERSIQNPKGKSNLEKGTEPQVDKTDPTQPVKVASDKESPQRDRKKNVGNTDVIGTA
ncbi:MAG TPA: hypothetical protein VGQ03_03220 [Nitrososphaera sp.]|jgi:hypothetical protein|nr:hypothetical protein [Nitrososphaera sp.]